jgi:hypothetical protein
MHPSSALAPELEAELALLEEAMPLLQARHLGRMFAFANAWAERHDALLERTPAPQLPEMQSRLRRIGIRWGVMPGARITRQFPAIVPARRRA